MDKEKLVQWLKKEIMKREQWIEDCKKEGDDQWLIYYTGERRAFGEVLNILEDD